MTLFYSSLSPPLSLLRAQQEEEPPLLSLEASHRFLSNGYTTGSSETNHVLDKPHDSLLSEYLRKLRIAVSVMSLIFAQWSRAWIYIIGRLQIDR